MKFNYLLAVTFVSFNLSAIEFAKELDFRTTCEYPAKTFHLGAVGDLLLHTGLQVQAATSPKRFISLWEKVTPYIKNVDIAYANFEGAASPYATVNGGYGKYQESIFDNHTYTSYPQFNYNPVLIEDLINSGFDFVSTSNNHSLDRSWRGVNDTIDQMDRFGMPFNGTRKKGEPTTERLYTIVQKNGLSVAFFSCTTFTNGITDTYKQVTNCLRDKQTILSAITKMYDEQSVDVIVVTPHWGTEYQHTPLKEQLVLAKEYINAGANVVIGNHPHVLQPWDIMESEKGHDGIIVYSLGNFVSGQSGTSKRSTLFLDVTICKDYQETNVTNASYIPLFMTKYPWQVQPITSETISNSEFKAALGLIHYLYPKASQIN